MYSMKVKCFQSQHNHSIPVFDLCVHLQFTYSCFREMEVCRLQHGFIDLSVAKYTKSTLSKLDRLALGLVLYNISLLWNTSEQNQNVGIFNFSGVNQTCKD